MMQLDKEAAVSKERGIASRGLTGGADPLDFQRAGDLAFAPAR